MIGTDQEIIEQIAEIPEEHRKEARQKVSVALSTLKTRLLLKSKRAPRTLADLDAILPKIQWLWHPWLPRGFVTLLVGKPGVGKSALALALAQTILRGTPWPDLSKNSNKGGLIVWADTESTHAITLERATDWGVRKDELIVPSVGEDLLVELRLDTDEGWWAMQGEAHRKNVRLIVIDSLRGSFRGSENRSEIVGFMSQLAELATRTQTPLLLIHHLRKRGLQDGDDIDIDRVRGSSAIVQMARCVWAVDKVHKDDIIVRCQQIKNNLARFPEPFGFEITERGVIFTEAPVEPQVRSQLDIAKDWLVEVLADSPVPASDIFKQGDNVGLSKRTVQRAKSALGINHIFQENQWFWTIAK